MQSLPSHPANSGSVRKTSPGPDCARQPPGRSFTSPYREIWCREQESEMAKGKHGELGLGQIKQPGIKKINKKREATIIV